MHQVRKDVLNGWKEIAAYLGRDPRTVERWEKQRALPVRRLPGSGRATVYALVAELDAWLASGALPLVEAPSPKPEAGTGTEARLAGPELAEASAVLTAPVTRPPARRLLRWAVVACVLAAVCWTSVAMVAWSRRRGPAASAGVERGREASYPAEARGTRLVPVSAVAGVDELYLRGCYQAEMRTPESLHRAQDAFTAALAKDPGYAPAFAGLASTFLLLREYAMMPDAEAYPRAREAAQKALALAPDLPQAHAVMGFVQFFWSWNTAAAEREFQAAMTADPGLPLAHHWYGSMLMHQGRFRQALEELNVAQRLDPTSAAILTTRAYALGLSGRAEQGIELLEEAINSGPAGPYRSPATMHQVRGQLSLLPPRDVPRFVTEMLVAAQLRQDSPTVSAMRMASEVYRTQGEAAMWRALLRDERRRHPAGSPTYAMARYEAQIGSREQALDDLRALYARHDGALMGLSVDPLLAELRQEPRFQQLRAAMGLPRQERN